MAGCTGMLNAEFPAAGVALVLPAGEMEAMLTIWLMPACCGADRGFGAANWVFEYVGEVGEVGDRGWEKPAEGAGG